jgi:hypothetical protein
MKLNENFLPMLDTALLDEIFAHVFSDDLTDTEDQQKKDFIQLLKRMQTYNYAYRQGALGEVVPMMEETFGPFITNSDGPIRYFALGLALKELYGMRGETFRVVMQQVTKSKLR